MQRIKHWPLSLLIITLLPFVLFWRWVLWGEVLFWGTALFQFWPWHSLVKTSLLAGQWPLWNPLLGNGTPLLANLQSAVFYPPNLLYLLLPIEHGLTLSVILHLALAGIFMYAYARRIGLAPFGATVSALTYMFSGYLAGRSQFVTMINTAAWLPIALLLCEKLVTRRTGLDILWLGLGLAGQLLAGHAQLWFYTLLLAGAYTLFRSWGIATSARSLKTNLQRLGQASGRFILAAGLAILLAAVQLLPTAEFAGQSPRGAGAEPTFALTYSFWPWRLITLLAPNFFGHPAQGNYWGYANYWEDHAYLGVLPFLLAFSAIWRYFRQRGQNDPRLAIYWPIVPFWMALIPISLVLAMGWNTPIYIWVFDTVPGFGYFQAPARLLIWYTVAMAILAGIGAEAFKIRPASRPNGRRLLVACLGLALAGLAGGLVLAGRGRTFLTATFTLGIWLALSIALLLTHPDADETPRPPAHPLLWQWAVIIFITIDLWLAASSLNPTLPPAIFRQPITSATLLKEQPGRYRFWVDGTFDHTIKFDHYFRFDTFGPHDVGDWQRLRETLVPNFGVYARLPSANNDDPLVVGRWQQFTALLENSGESQRARLLGLMNVGYLVSGPDNAIWPTLYAGETMAIQQVPNPLPRAYFVPQAYPAKDEAEAMARLTSPDFDPRQEVVIMGSEADPAAQNSKVLAGLPTQSNRKDSPVELWPAAVTEQEPGRILLEIAAPTSGFIVLTDTYYPGWQATVDDQPVQIWPANLAFRAVAVQAGTHNIIFSYRPRSFITGFWISTGTLLAVIVTGSYLIKNNNRNRP